jgi:hypothetical protein
MLKLHVCKIARKGKAARGTVEVQTFGIPKPGEDGVTREWDYTPYAGLDHAELAEFLRPFGNINIALIQKIDEWRKSETMRNQNETVLLAAQIEAESLLLQNEEAADIAKALIRARKDAVTLWGADPVKAMETMLEKRRNIVDKDRKKRGMAPRLIKKPAVTADDLADNE